VKNKNLCNPKNKSLINIEKTIKATDVYNFFEKMCGANIAVAIIGVKFGGKLISLEPTKNIIKKIKLKNTDLMNIV
tara:strand:- start:13 stop:240 length:228 start_codon:yes stop_codon:yes gene_type:complete